MHPQHPAGPSATARPCCFKRNDMALQRPGFPPSNLVVSVYGNIDVVVTSCAGDVLRISEGTGARTARAFCAAGDDAAAKAAPAARANGKRAPSRVDDCCYVPMVSAAALVKCCRDCFRSTEETERVDADTYVHHSRDTGQCPPLTRPSTDDGRAAPSKR